MLNICSDTSTASRSRTGKIRSADCISNGMQIALQNHSIPIKNSPGSNQYSETLTDWIINSLWYLNFQQQPLPLKVHFAAFSVITHQRTGQEIPPTTCVIHTPFQQCAFHRPACVKSTSFCQHAHQKAAPSQIPSWPGILLLSRFGILGSCSAHQPLA